MASIALTEDQVINDHLEQYNEIKKKFPTGDINFSYEYCVLLDGTEPDMSTVDNYVLSAFRKWGVSVDGKQNRKKSSILLKSSGIQAIDVPPVIRKLFVDNYNKLKKEESDRNTKTANLDSILRKVGKKGSSAVVNKSPGIMNGLQLMQSLFSAPPKQPVAPTLEDLIAAEPDVYQKYLQIADGTKLVTFGPLHPQSDQWGFLVHDVYGAYTPVNKEDNRTRIIFLDGIHSCVLFGPENKTDNTLELWISLQESIITKLDKAEKGTQFKGWKNAKEYKNTDNEIAAMIGGRIFMTELKLF